MNEQNCNCYDHSLCARAIEELKKQAEDLRATLREREAELTEAKKTIDSLHEEVLDEIQHRDHFENQCSDMAAQAGCSEEWSNLHDHSTCVRNEVQALLNHHDELEAKLSAAQSELAEARKGLVWFAEWIITNKNGTKDIPAWVARAVEFGKKNFQTNNLIEVNCEKHGKSIEDIKWKCPFCWQESYDKLRIKDAENQDYIAALEKQFAELESTVARLSDAAEMLWVVLANVSGGDWTKQTQEWQKAARQWVDNFFKVWQGPPSERVRDVDNALRIAPSPSANSGEKP